MTFFLGESIVKNFYGKKLNDKIFLNGSNSSEFNSLKSFLDEFNNVFGFSNYDIVENKDRNFFSFLNIRYYGIPSGNELEPFLKSLIENKCINVKNNIKLELFVASLCPHCPAVFNSVIDIVNEHCVELNVYFSDHCPLDLSENEIMSVPTLLIKENGVELARWTGQINRFDVQQTLQSNDKNNLSEDYFINILEQGRAEDLAQMIFDEKKLFTGFTSLFLNSQLSVRLGAVVAAEYLKEKSDELFEDLIEGLFSDYSDYDVNVKGDFLYLCSLSIFKSNWTDRLEILLKNESEPLVKDCIEEALDALKIN